MPYIATPGVESYPSLLRSEAGEPHCKQALEERCKARLADAGPLETPGSTSSVEVGAGRRAPCIRETWPLPQCFRGSLVRPTMTTRMRTAWPWNKAANHARFTPVLGYWACRRRLTKSLGIGETDDAAVGHALAKLRVALSAARHMIAQDRPAAVRAPPSAQSPEPTRLRHPAAARSSAQHEPLGPPDWCPPCGHCLDRA